MKKFNKKGFTIVELVIVIAVIAILSAVLIPTFSSLVKKANRSADEQAVNSMNQALVIGEVDGKIITIEQAANALSEAGYNKELIPVTKNYSFYWYPAYNKVVLVDGDNKLVYPTNDEEIVSNFDKDFETFYNLRMAHVKIEVSNENITEALANGNNVSIKESIEITNPISDSSKNSRPYGLLIPEGEAISMDLGGNTIEADSSTVAILVEGELQLKNGTVSSRSIVVKPGGKLTIEDDVTIIAAANNGGQAIRNEGGIVVINGGTFKSLNGDCAGDFTQEPACIYNTGVLTINSGTFENISDDYAILSSGGILTINNCTVLASRGALSITGGKAYINGGTFETNSKYNGNVELTSAHVLYVASSDINTEVHVNGGTFTNLAGGSLISDSYNKVVDNTKILKK